ncbi:MAG: HAD-IA family hydrolase [Negativicutes bacterium]|nr:HAD-IA family hydrolase [Negativicutes bacterium]
MNPTTLLFDLDGTLIDTRALVVASFQHTFRTVLGLEISAEEVLNDYGRPLTYSFGRYTNDAAVIREMLQIYRRHNLAAHDQMAQPFPFIQEDLQALQQAGYPMGVVSSKKRLTVMKGIRLFQMEAFFQVYVCEEDTKIHKPQAEPLLEACRLLQIEPSAALYTGDSPYDILCAKAAGSPSAAVLWSNFPSTVWDELQPDYRLQRLADLLAYLQ